MSFSDYGTFKASVAGYLARPDLTARIPDFVQLAEGRMNRVLKIGAGEIASTALTVNTETIDLPTDFNAMRLLALSTSVTKPLMYMTPEILLQQFPSTSVGMPRAYTVHGKDGVSDVMQARFRPIPDGTYNLLAFYYKKIPTLVGGADAGTNWMLSNNPDLYLYATLLEATPYIHDDARIPVWEKAYSVAVGDLKAQDQDRRWAGMSLRSRPGFTMIRGM